MSLLGLNVKEFEEELAEPGEHPVRIISAKPKTFKSGREGAVVALSITDAPSSPNVFFNILGAAEGDAEDTIANFTRQAKNFCEAFDLDPESPSIWEDAVGQEAFAILKIEDDEEYGKSNRVSYFRPQK